MSTHLFVRLRPWSPQLLRSVNLSLPRSLFFAPLISAQLFIAWLEHFSLFFSAPPGCHNLQRNVNTCLFFRPLLVATANAQFQHMCVLPPPRSPQPMRCVNTCFAAPDISKPFPPLGSHIDGMESRSYQHNFTCCVALVAASVAQIQYISLFFPLLISAQLFIAWLKHFSFFRAPWSPQPSTQCQHMSFSAPLGRHNQCVVSTHVFFRPPPPPWSPQPMRCVNTCFAAPDI